MNKNLYIWNMNLAATQKNVAWLKDLTICFKKSGKVQRQWKDYSHNGGDGSDCLLKAVVLDLLNAVILQYSSLCCGDP